MDNNLNMTGQDRLDALLFDIADLLLSCQLSLGFLCHTDRPHLTIKLL